MDPATAEVTEKLAGAGVLRGSTLGRRLLLTKETVKELSKLAERESAWEQGL